MAMLLTTSRKTNAPLAMVALIWSRRELLCRSVLVSLRQRFAGSTLGLAWLVLGPALLLMLYAVIYLVIFQVRPVGMEPPTYVLYIFSGLVPLLGFSQGLMQGTVSLSGSRDLLLNTIFPPELVPLRETAIAMVSLGIGLAITAAFALLLGKVAWTWLLVPVFLVLMLMLLRTLLDSFPGQLDLQGYPAGAHLRHDCAAGGEPDRLHAGYASAATAAAALCQSTCLLRSGIPIADRARRAAALAITVGCVCFAFGSFLLGAWVFTRAKVVFFDYA